MGVATTLRSGGGTDTSDATASAEYILVGYTGYVKDQLIVGTMPDNGAVDVHLNCGESYKIPAGYHNGEGKVTQNLQTQSGWTIVPSTTNQIGCPANRYCTGDIYVKGDPNLIAENIKKGVDIFGVTGTYQGF